MNPQQALEILQSGKQTTLARNSGKTTINEALDIAIDAVKKQIPMKMRVRRFNVNGKLLKYRICKSCGYTYGDVYMNYCSACGQKILHEKGE